MYVQCTLMVLSFYFFSIRVGTLSWAWSKDAALSRDVRFQNIQLGSKPSVHNAD